MNDDELTAVRDEVVRALRTSLSQPTHPNRRKGDRTRKQEKARRKTLVRALQQRSPITARDWLEYRATQREKQMPPRVTAAIAKPSGYREDEYVIATSDIGLQPGDEFPAVMSTDLGNGKPLCRWPNPQVPFVGNYKQLFGTLRLIVLPPKEKA